MLAAKTVWIVLVALMAVSAAAEDSGQCEDRGFLERPPVFIDSQPDIPLASMGIGMPEPGKVVPDFDSSAVRSIAFNQDGNNVQPALSVTLTTIRAGALYGFRRDLAAGISIPWRRTAIRGQTGGQPTTSTVQSIGQLNFGAKKLLWEGCDNRRIVLSAGIELPTGLSDATYEQTNSVTTAYYGYNRLPLGWQPGTGTVNAYLGLAYGQQAGRLGYTVVLAGKLYGEGKQNVQVGDILIASGAATYGISRDLAFSLGVTLRNQGDDSYPEAPPPGVQQPATVGTTTHGTFLSLDPSIRVRVLGKIVVGVGFMFPVTQPSDGMVPEGTLSVIFYPTL